MHTPDLSSATSRRQLLTMAMVGGAAIVGADTASASPRGQPSGSVRLTVLGTTDLHPPTFFRKSGQLVSGTTPLVITG